MENQAADQLRVSTLTPTARECLASCGYCRLPLGIEDPADHDAAPEALGAIVRSICQPIEVFPGVGLWRNLGVDLTRPKDRSGGVGFQCLHLDFVNAEMPPDYVFLFCVRPDPHGGGASLVAPASIVEDLSAKSRSELQRPIFRDGKVDGLLNVGCDVNPFAVFQPRSRFPLRYTAKLRASTGNPDARKALDELDALLRSRTQRIPLLAGDLLIVDQRRALHGRVSLEGEQHALADKGRRLVLHGFGRDDVRP